MSATLFDLGVYLFHNALELGKQQGGAYITIPKLESAEEALFYANVLEECSRYLQLQTDIKVSVVVETIRCVSQLDEIIYALRHYIVSLNAGKWGYQFDIIKKFMHDKNLWFPTYFSN